MKRKKQLGKKKKSVAIIKLTTDRNNPQIKVTHVDSSNLIGQFLKKPPPPAKKPAPETFEVTRLENSFEFGFSIAFIVCYETFYRLEVLKGSSVLHSAQCSTLQEAKSAFRDLYRHIKPDIKPRWEQ